MSPQTGSSPFSFSTDDLKTVAKGASIVIAGAAATALANYAMSLDLSTTTGIVSAAVAGIVVNLLHKYVTDTRQP